MHNSNSGSWKSSWSRLGLRGKGKRGKRTIASSSRRSGNRWTCGHRLTRSWCTTTGRSSICRPGCMSDDSPPATEVGFRSHELLRIISSQQPLLHPWSENQRPVLGVHFCPLLSTLGLQRLQHSRVAMSNFRPPPIVLPTRILEIVFEGSPANFGTLEFFLRH